MYPRGLARNCYLDVLRVFCCDHQLHTVLRTYRACIKWKHDAMMRELEPDLRKTAQNRASIRPLFISLHGQCRARGLHHHYSEQPERPDSSLFARRMCEKIEISSTSE